MPTYGGACSLQARSHPEHTAAKRGHHRLFFWSEKKGGSSAPSEPPLATCLDSPYGERAQSTVLTRAPPRRPARPRWDFIFNLSMRESKASSVVVCLHHAGERRHFRLVVSSSVAHCCQHFWVGWGPNRIKGGLRRGKCQRDIKQALQIFIGRLQLDDADVVVYKGSKTPLPCCRAVERACFGCARSVALVTLINMAGGACKYGWLTCASS